MNVPVCVCVAQSRDVLVSGTLVKSELWWHEWANLDLTMRLLKPSSLIPFVSNLNAMRMEGNTVSEWISLSAILFSNLLSILCTHRRSLREFTLNFMYSRWRRYAKIIHTLANGEVVASPRIVASPFRFVPINKLSAASVISIRMTSLFQLTLCFCFRFFIMHLYFYGKSVQRSRVQREKVSLIFISRLLPRDCSFVSF